MHKVILNEKEFLVSDGTVLSDILTEQGFYVDHPCGRMGKCSKCTVLVNGKEELSCLYKVKEDIEVSLLNNGDTFSFSGAQTTGVLSDNICFALDIGSTTLALALVSWDSGDIIDVKTCDNPQKAFGADVISRIDYCIKNGITDLNSSLCSAINSLISQFGVTGAEKLYASGNATMLHTLFGVDCSSMGTAPYTPAFLESKTASASSLGIHGVETVISLPSIASFVGADIVAGLNLVNMQKAEKHSLLIDLGTNAEIALFSRDSVLCTAAAAGPCFEGANISCGMGATPGAIYAYSTDGAKTIADAKPKGICGTGLIDVIAFLIKENIVDETGFMEDETFEIAENVSITQKDIRQYQLAKSAVFSSVLTLMKLKNIGYEDIDKVYISGGFSNKLNVKNAISTGLLPSEFSGKCVVLNNSCLLGTAKYTAEENDLTQIVNRSVYVDLSSDAGFSELFVENMILGEEI